MSRRRKERPLCVCGGVDRPFRLAVYCPACDADSRPAVALLPILMSCVKKLGEDQVQTLTSVWEHERRIAEITGRVTPKDMHIVLTAFEERLVRLRSELEYLEEINTPREGTGAP